MTPPTTPREALADILADRLTHLDAEQQRLADELARCQHQRERLFAALERPQDTQEPAPLSTGVSAPERLLEPPRGQNEGAGGWRPAVVYPAAWPLEAPGDLLGACLTLLQRFVDLNDGLEASSGDFLQALDTLADDCRAVLVRTETP